MTEQRHITIFGEVLFDCFPNGERILGGAPFNIAWHLQALEDRPTFLSRVGKDELGDQILQNATNWGLSTDHIQRDPEHPTGQVDVTVIDDEPHYQITPGRAYDFIDATDLQLDTPSGILYHGSLALRSDYAKTQLAKIKALGDWSIFLDVNLRAPWWDKTALFDMLEDAKWVKLNIDELHELGFNHADIEKAMQQFLNQFDLQQVIVTKGAEGSSVLTKNAFHNQLPGKIAQFVDTVGAGDAFTSIYIHGLIKNWTIEKTLSAAQQFASQVIGLRGATSDNKAFYQQALSQL